MRAHPFLFFAVVVLPYLLIAAGLLWAIRAAWRSQSPARPLFFYPLLATLPITAAFVAWGLNTITASLPHSALAAVGFVFLPFYSVAVAVIGFVVSGAILYVLRFLLERLCGLAPRLTSRFPLALSLLILALTASRIHHHIEHQRLLAKAESGTAEPALIDRAIKSRDPELLAALAKNPRTPPDGLSALSRDPDSSIRARIGINPGTPPEILASLARDKDPQVRSSVTAHPNISKELLLKLARDSDQAVQSCAESNLRHKGWAESLAPAANPQDEAFTRMAQLGRHAASGDLKAVDEIVEQHRQLYEGVDLKNDRPKTLANLKLMRAAFDILGNEAATSGEAMKALEYAAQKPSLRAFTVDAFGLAAGAGNREALLALLDYPAKGWLLSSTVSAMKYPAKAGQPQAIDFLASVLDDPKDKPLHHMARQGLKDATEAGSPKAAAVLSAHPEK